MDRVVIYTKTDKKKKLYKRMQARLIRQDLDFSEWGILAMKFYLDNNLNFNDKNKAK